VNDRSQLVEDLHRRYSGVIFDLCLRILRNRAQAEDAVQETFMNAFRAMSTFRYGKNHLPWLYRIGTNVCLKMIRRQKFHNEEGMDYDGQRAPGIDPAGKIDARRILEKLQKDLDERDMEIIVSHYISGMSQGEIAQSLGISRRAVVKRFGSLRNRFDSVFREVDIHE